MGTAEEIRSILDAKRSAAVAEAKDPSDEAAKLIKEGSKLMGMVMKHVKSLEASFARANQQQTGLERQGVGTTEATTLLSGPIRELKALAEFAASAEKHARKIQDKSKNTGSLGFREGVDGSWDGALLEMRGSAGETVMSPDNSVAGEQAKEAKKAAAYMDTLRKVKAGDQVVVGNRSFTALQPAQDMPDSMGPGGHVVVLGGAGSAQYQMLVPAASGNGRGGTISMMSMGSAVPMAKSLAPADIEHVTGDHGVPGARHDSSELEEWDMVDDGLWSSCLKAALQGNALSVHTEDQDGDSETIARLRMALRERGASGAFLEGRSLDLATVYALVQTHDALGEENREKFGAMGVRRMVDVVTGMRSRSAA